MEDLVITVNNIEEWQTLNDTNNLGRVFRKAQSVLVGGGKVVLERAPIELIKEHKLATSL